MTTVYLVDDHPIVREGLRAVLELAGHCIVGESGDPIKAMGDVERLNPEIVLLDLALGQQSGFDLLEGLRRSESGARTIALTMSAQPRDLAEALRLGAAGYVLKGASSKELLSAIGEVMAGGRYLSSEVVDLSAKQTPAPWGEASALESLSAREREIVLLVVQGQSSSEIGQRLHLSPKTVDSYRSRVMAKAGVANVAALVRWAIRVGLISAEEAEKIRAPLHSSTGAVR